MGLFPTGLGSRFWSLVGATFLGFLGIGTVLPALAPHVRHDLGGSDQTVGFAIGQATQEAAAKWKNVRFIGVDQFQERPVENLAGLVFEEDKAGYLAGALAGMLTHTNVVAAVLGTDLVPPVVKFGKGYEAGAKATKPEIKVLTAYHPGGLAKGFTDPDWGRSTTAHNPAAVVI